MIRTVQLCLIVGALAGCASSPNRLRTPAAFQSAWGVAEQVCAQPTSHSQIASAVHSLDWTLLKPEELPPQVVGNGMVTWSEAATSQKRDMTVAVGRLGTTSFCRVYVESGAAGPVQSAMEDASILGGPLGTPDFHQRLDGADVKGWHRSAGDDWRAVHLSVQHPGGLVDKAPLMIEVTRSTL